MLFRLISDAVDLNQTMRVRSRRCPGAVLSVIIHDLRTNSSTVGVDEGEEVKGKHVGLDNLW